MQIRSHIIFRRFLSTLVVAHLLPVEPDEGCTLGFLHAQEHLLSLPSRWQSEGFSIGTRWVVFSRHKRRIRLERSSHIAEEWVAVTLHFPVTWHMNSGPLPILEVRRKEILRHLFRSIGKEKAPISIEGKMLTRQIIGVSFLLILLKNGGVFQIIIHVLQVLSIHLQRESCEKAKGKSFDIHIYVVYKSYMIKCVLS